jgi:hypothetical protein
MPLKPLPEGLAVSFAAGDEKRHVCARDGEALAPA